jgi:hypothetical protein
MLSLPQSEFGLGLLSSSARRLTLGFFGGQVPAENMQVVQPIPANARVDREGLS